MKELFKSKLFYLLLAAVLVLGVMAVVTSGGRSAATWVESAVTSITKPIQTFSVKASNAVVNFVERIFKTTDADKENEQLRVRVAQLESVQREAEELQQENERLRALLNYSGVTENYEYVTADVIAKSPGMWFDTFMLNAGRNQGVTEDLAVVNAAGLVGRVYEVGANTCKVISLIDAASDVSVMVERTRDNGFVRGIVSEDASDLVELYYLSSASDLVPGDVLLTSGLGGVYPKGVTVGSVLEVSRAAETAEDRNAIVQPAVDFRHLEEVMIVKLTDEEG